MHSNAKYHMGLYFLLANYLVKEGENRWNMNSCRLYYAILIMIQGRDVYVHTCIAKYIHIYGYVQIHIIVPSDCHSVQ